MLVDTVNAYCSIRQLACKTPNTVEEKPWVSSSIPQAIAKVKRGGMMQNPEGKCFDQSHTKRWDSRGRLSMVPQGNIPSIVAVRCIEDLMRLKFHHKVIFELGFLLLIHLLPSWGLPPNWHRLPPPQYTLHTTDTSCSSQGGVILLSYQHLIIYVSTSCHATKHKYEGNPI